MSALSAQAMMVARSLRNGSRLASDYADIDTVVKRELLDGRIIQMLRSKTTGEMRLALSPEGWVAITPPRRPGGFYMAIPQEDNDNAQHN